MYPIPDILYIIMYNIIEIVILLHMSVADPDLEAKGGFSSKIFCFTQNKGGGWGRGVRAGPSCRSPTTCTLLPQVKCLSTSHLTSKSKISLNFTSHLNLFFNSLPKLQKVQTTKI